MPRSHGSRPASRRRTASHRNRRSLLLESLERRELLAATGLENGDFQDTPAAWGTVDGGNGSAPPYWTPWFCDGRSTPNDPCASSAIEFAESMYQDTKFDILPDQPSPTFIGNGGSRYAQIGARWDGPGHAILTQSFPVTRGDIVSGQFRFAVSGKTPGGDFAHIAIQDSNSNVLEPIKWGTTNVGLDRTNRLHPNLGLTSQGVMSTGDGVGGFRKDTNSGLDTNWQTWSYTVGSEFDGNTMTISALSRKVGSNRYRVKLLMDNIQVDRNNAPVVNVGGDYGTHNDNHDHRLSWTAYDTDGTNGQRLSSVSAFLKRNGTTISSSTSTSSYFTITPSMGLGTYTLEVTARDQAGLVTTRTRSFTLVDDDNSGPTISLSNGSTSDGGNNYVRWEVSDPSGIYRTYARITKGSSTIFAGYVNPSVTYSLNGHGVGTYTLTVTSWDNDIDRGSSDRRSSSKSLTYTVGDDDTTAPSISFDNAVDQSDGDPNSVGWTITDTSGISSRTVELRRGSTLLYRNQIANVGNFPMDGLQPGTYTISATATDADLDWSGDQKTAPTISKSFTISDDDTDVPEITTTGLNDQTDGADNQLAWSISDDSGISTRSVNLRRQSDGLVVMSDGLQNVGAFDLNGLLGTYRLEVSATDSDTDWGVLDRKSVSWTSAWFTISDDDVDEPVISLSSSGAVDGDQPSVAWTVADASSLAAVSVRVEKDGETIFEDDVAAVDSFALPGSGQYHVTVTAVDDDSDRGEPDQLTGTETLDITITDDDTTAPEISFGNAVGQPDSADNTVSWTISDASGIGQRDVKLFRDGEATPLLQDTANDKGSFDLNGLVAGVYRIEATATDGDDEGADDALSNARSVTFSIIDDDTAGPTITLGGSTGVESHSLSQAFSWDIYDPSGLSSISVVVEQSGVLTELFSTTDPSDYQGNFNFDSYGLGTFRIVADATDADNDTPGDTSTTSNVLRSVDVVNATPVTRLQGDSAGAEDETLSFDGSTSSDADDDIVRYDWDFGDGVSATGLQASHAYAVPGSYDVVLTVTDSYNAESSVTQAVTVSEVNDPPEASDDTLTVAEDGSESINVLVNDAPGPAHESGQSLSVVSATAEHGSVSIGTGGLLTYTPDEDYFGPDVIAYEIEDDGTTGGLADPLRAQAEVAVSVTPVNDLPVVVAESDTLSEDGSVMVNVLANDAAGPANEALQSLSVVAASAVHGDVSIGTDGVLTYTPNPDYYGTDTVTYTVEDDGITGSESDPLQTVGTVSLTIESVTDVIDDWAATDEDNAVTLNVLANDSFAGTPVVTLVTDGTNGTVAIGSGGDVTYTPNPDFYGDDSFTYTVASGGVAETATVLISVAAVDDIMEDAGTIDEDGVWNLNVLANDSFEGVPVLTAVTHGAHGTVAFLGDGSVTYTPVADFNGSDSFEYTVTSGGVTESVLVDVTINPVADVLDDASTTDEDVAVTVSVLDNDGFANVASVTSVTDGAHGTVAIDPSGTVTYTPIADFFGTDSFSYTVTSGGVEETATVDVTVVAVVDIADDVISTSEDVAVTMNVLANDSFDGAPVISGVTQGSTGTVSVGVGGEIHYSPATNAHGSDSFTYTVTSGGVTETATVSVSIAAVADVPTLELTAADGLEASAIDLSILSELTDPDGSELLSLTISGMPANAQLSAGAVQANGDVTLTPSQLTGLSILVDDQLTFDLTVTATATEGSNGDQANQSGTLSVNIQNVAPSFDSASVDPNVSIPENLSNGTLVAILSASDPAGSQDPLTYTIIGGDGQAVFAIDPLTGEITVTDETQLDYESTPSFQLLVEVDDGDGGSATSTVTVDLLNQASIAGTVFLDANQNQVFEANELGLDGVIVDLLDADDNVVETYVTSDGGLYWFEDYDPGDYFIRQQQPSGVADGPELVGSQGGSIDANDLISLTLGRIDAADYVFTEHGQAVGSGEAAEVGFWQNKHGQNLISQGGAELADWLGEQFPNVFGNSLDNASGAEVADFYRNQLFKQKGKKSAVPPKVDAHFMAIAFASYFTNRNLAGELATDFGFSVTDLGLGARTVNVGDAGRAFNAIDNTDVAIMSLLKATDSMTDKPDSIQGFAFVYDENGDGVIDADEKELRQLANDLFAQINQQGSI